MDELIDTQSHTEASDSEPIDTSYDFVVVVDKDVEHMSPDAQDVLSLTASHMEEQYPGHTVDLEAILKNVKSKEAVAILLRVNGEKAGYVYAAIGGGLFLDIGKSCVVHSFYVLPNYRNTNAYRYLMSAMASFAKGIGCGVLLVETNDDRRNPIEWMGGRKVQTTWGVTLR